MILALTEVPDPFRLTLVGNRQTFGEQLRKGVFQL